MAILRRHPQRIIACSLTAMGSIAALALAGCQSDDQNSAPGPRAAATAAAPLVVGINTDTPGFSFGPPENPQGMDIDLMNWVGKALQRPTPPTIMTAGNRGVYLKTKRATIIIATYSITPQRRQDGIEFAGPYMVSSQALLVRTDDWRISDKSSVKNKSVCGVSGTTGSSVTIPGAITSTKAKSVLQCVKLLSRADTDAVFDDTLVLYGYMQRYPGKYRVVLPGVFGELQYYGIGFLANSPGLCKDLTQVIQNYLLTQWQQDFQSTFPSVASKFPDYASRFKPAPADVDNYDCTDRS
jgi:glutamate transport system substrate-binding protein